MAGYKLFVFDPRDLVRLMTHYTDGEVPLNAEVSNVLFHPQLERMMAIEVMSNEWETMTPLHIRYTGKKVMSWHKGLGVDHPEWVEANDTPSRQ
jgi:hypothetical protein